MINQITACPLPPLTSTTYSIPFVTKNYYSLTKVSSSVLLKTRVGYMCLAPVDLVNTYSIIRWYASVVTASLS